MHPSWFLYLLVLSQLLQNFKYWICPLRIAVGKINFSFDYCFSSILNWLSFIWNCFSQKFEVMVLWNLKMVICNFKLLICNFELSICNFRLTIRNLKLLLCEVWNCFCVKFEIGYQIVHLQLQIAHLKLQIAQMKFQNYH